MEALTVPQGKFVLKRFPHRPKESLRAWDAADEYLLHELAADTSLAFGATKILILNDQFGALTVALSEHPLHMASDSYLSHQGTLVNLQENGRPIENVRLLTSLEGLEGRFDLFLIKVPKSLALLEDQLFRLRPHLLPHSRVIGTGMARSIHTSTLSLFERIIGPTHTSLARKKARLIFSQPDSTITPSVSPYPSSYHLENPPFQLHNHANVFSRDSLDIGTRFLLAHLPTSTGPQHIIDLGCGNGVVGLVMASANPQAQLSFIDESFMAIASAQINFNAAFGDHRQAHFKVNDGLNGMPPQSADLILCNPPFHQQNAHDIATALDLFKGAKATLKQGGALWIVGNRHLGYHVKLNRLFGRINLIASNRKFVIIQAIKL
jgi:23S rRNA (guanine1835-N2)-methyltransferase